MGKQKSGAAKLGVALKSARQNQRTIRYAEVGARYVHPTEEVDKNKEKAKKIQSQTQLSSAFDEMLESAVLADKSFAVEKQNAVIITSQAFQVEQGLTKEQQELMENSWNLLTIPRRPEWTPDMSAEQVNRNEREAFLNWRRELAKIEEEDKLAITPFEKNVEVWKQLWRVVERSSVVVQIVDARNPLLFRSPDLEKYVHEVDPNKRNVLLVNKADFLTTSQRRKWSEHFDSEGIEHVFWSAGAEWERIQEAGKQAKEDAQEPDVLRIEQGMLELMSPKVRGAAPEPLTGNRDKRVDHAAAVEAESHTDAAPAADVEVIEDWSGGEEEFDEDEDDEEESADDDAEDVSGDEEEPEPSASKGPKDSPAPAVVPEGGVASAVEPRSAVDEAPRAAALEPEERPKSSRRDKSRIVTREELLQYLLSFQDAEDEYDEDGKVKRFVIGMVGYPNVGKSSTINVLCADKKVAVSATPGKTKHFQTINIGENILLCDCPGLVFPTFVASKADMLCNGLMPIDQMRDFRSPVTLVSRRIPRPVLERAYGIVLPDPADHEDPNRPPTAQELLWALATVRGFVVGLGEPHEAQAARVIMRDYTAGRLVYVHPPPGVDSAKFNRKTKSLRTTADEGVDVASEAMAGVAAAGKKKGKKSSASTPAERKPTVVIKNPMEDEFFLQQNRVQAHTAAGRYSTVYTRTQFQHSPTPMTKKPTQKERRRLAAIGLAPGVKPKV
eukprot:TRINITY_DN30712_c0_g1_i1.p1 TRINITY_DN30712_c0_g1~~TRINITY_DN30712_c0_g1_i1.p1  ORF type:complete len:726 (-),score=289.15 TRINITY_DN30712_c0_g1_i1:389-2566(-)